MENKYYTPTIEEFHVGFEFEQKIGTSVSTKEEVWVKSIFEFIPNADKILSILSDDLIRVKLLDREDIESLGFELYVIKEYTISFLKKCTGFSVFIIYQETNTVISVYINAEKIFLGNIKNKSELQKLMTQLNIK